jgi:type I restriction enzyme, S subunit
MTEYGVDWEVRTIGDLVTHETAGIDPSDADGLPYVGLKHIEPQETTLNRWEDASTVRSRKTLFKRGDILYGKLRPYLDKAVLADRSGISSTDILVLRPNPDVDPYFMAGLLHTRPFVAHAMATTAGVNHPRTSWTAISQYEVRVPPPSEQQEIAHVLRTVQRAKETTEQVSAAARELKKSLMQRLFTGLSGSARSIDTEFGTIPAHWRVTPLSDCAEIQTGVAKGRHINNGDQMEVPYLRVANVQDGYLDLGEIKTIAIRSSELSRFSLRVGDILLTEGGDFDKLGRGHIWGGQIDPCLHQNHIFAVRPNPDLLTARFASYLIQSSYARAYFLKVAHRTTNLASINKTKLGAFPMLIPPLNEQREIERQLGAADRKIAAEEARADALTALFDSLLHALMTARLRVVDLTTEVA